MAPQKPKVDRNEMTVSETEFVGLRGHPWLNKLHVEESLEGKTMEDERRVMKEMWREGRKRKKKQQRKGKRIELWKKADKIRKEKVKYNSEENCMLLFNTV